MARVAVLGSYAPSLINFRAPLLRCLVERGHEVVALAPMDSSVDSPAPALRQLGVEFEALNFERNRIDPRGDLALTNRLRGVLRRRRVDQLLTYTLKPNVYGAMAGAAAGVRTAGMVTGMGNILLGSGAKRAVALNLLRVAGRIHRRIFVQNPDDAEDLVRLRVCPREKIVRTFGSGVPLDEFPRAPLPASPAVLMLARITAEKGIHEFLEAARRVHQLVPELPIRLAGMFEPGGITKADFSREAEAAGVEYLGALDDVRPAIEAASIYVLPSWHEGTPRSVLEAMAMGRAIITSDARGCRETIEDGVQGRLVPVRDAAVLADAILDLAGDPSLVVEMGAAARRRAEDCFDARSVASTIVDALDLRR